MTAKTRPPYVFAVIVALLGLPLLVFGIRLIGLGGSWYYSVAGAALIASAVLLARGSYAGAWIYGLTLLATLIWGLVEVGLDLWALMPRLLALSIIGLWLLTPWTR